MIDVLTVEYHKLRRDESVKRVLCFFFVYHFFCVGFRRWLLISCPASGTDWFVSKSEILRAGAGDTNSRRVEWRSVERRKKVFWRGLLHKKRYAIVTHETFFLVTSQQLTQPTDG